MPCTITGTLEGDARLAMEEALLDKSKLVKKYRKEKLKAYSNAVCCHESNF